MDVLTLDLLAAAGPWTAHVLNQLPDNARSAISEGIADGAWTEIRIGILNNAATIRLMLVSLDGTAVEIGKLDHIPN